MVFEANPSAPNALEILPSFILVAPILRHKIALNPRLGYDGQSACVVFRASSDTENNGKNHVKLHFLGANRQVTGSRYCLEVGNQQVMIDCGLFQERKFQDRNWGECPIPPNKLDAMLLTHAHADHCALIPKLVRDGFSSPIFATEPTVPLTEVVMRDSAKIQEEDAAYKKKRHEREHRKGKYPETPLYTEEDVDRAVPLFKAVKYNAPTKIVPGVTATFHEAGHILGSSAITVEAVEGDLKRTIVFSGDIGQHNKPIIRDPAPIAHADYLILESTYGDKNHERHGDIETQLAEVIGTTAARGGKVVIPTFAIERAQELCYFISRLAHDKRIPPLDVYLDSPMAVDVTEIFMRFKEYFDAESWNHLNAGKSPLRFPGLKFVRTADDSKRINTVKEPCVIMSSSGMCNAGRIKHHLRNNIEDARSTILFVGHQSVDTLGRLIVDGAREVRIHGGTYRVRAKIAQLFGFSGHADQTGLLEWLGAFRDKPKRIFLTHGEEDVSLGFMRLLNEKHGQACSVPNYREVVELK